MIFPRPPKPLHTRQQHDPEARVCNLTDPISNTSNLRYLPGGFTLNEIKMIIRNHKTYPSSIHVCDPGFAFNDDHLNRPSLRRNSGRSSIREHKHNRHIREMIGDKGNCDEV